MKRIFMALSLLLSCGIHAEGLNNANEIVARANLAAYYAGKDGRSEARMVIVDAQGREQRRQFTVLRRTLEAGGDQEFLVVFSRPSDVRGTVVASRIFLPEEYLQLKRKSLRLLPPEALTDISMEIKDPGPTAMTYEFNFL